MAAERGRTERGGRVAWGILLLGLCLFISLSLFSYDWRDISALRVPVNDPPVNLIGPVGAWLSFLLLMAFGVSAYIIPLWCLGFGLVLVLDREDRVWPRGIWIVVAAVALMALLELFDGAFAGVCRRLNLADTAGLLGRLLTRGILVRLLSPIGAGIVLGVTVVASIVIVVEMRNLVSGIQFMIASFRGTAGGLRERVATQQEIRTDERRPERPRPDAEPRRRDESARRKEEEARRQEDEEAREREEAREKEEQAKLQEKEDRRRRRLERVMQPETPAAPVPAAAPAPARPRETEPVKAAPPEPVVVQGEEADARVTDTPPPEPKPVREPAPRKVAPAKAEPSAESASETHVTSSRPEGTSAYQLPSCSLLDEPKAAREEIQADTATTSKILLETLAEFGIEADVTNVEKGPTVTRYELLPAAGVRVERISGLSNNLALALKASSVRVQAPIPGKGVVGIEVPNSSATVVYLRDVLEGEAWKTSKAKLPLMLGKDVGGNDVVADLATMPHMLVAGATGSGKTVCTNSIIAGLLMSRTPDQLRLMLVDPKIVEFSVYNSLPHLVVPVITNPKKVALALRWAINEMEKRYKLFAKVGVRNIESYNTREIAKQEDLFAAVADGAQEERDEPPARVPYIVVIIDELADLMLVDQAEIENAIARLAQLSRAVGIHMILCTQRPSVNVITGTIKANFPSRIAFQVAQKTDSRTILDTIGAEKLLGRGDMLFLPPGTAKMIRAQGVLTTDDEIRRVVDYIKKQAEPEYELEIKEKIEKQASKLEEGEDDELINQAVQIIRETQRASTSSLQRRLRIGYTRAARVMDILEERGIVGPPRGSDAREIMVDLDGDIDGNAPGSEPAGESGELV